MLIEGNEEKPALDPASTGEPADDKPLVLERSAKPDDDEGDDEAPRQGKSRHPSSSNRGGRLREIQAELAELKKNSGAWPQEKAELQRELNELKSKLGAQPAQAPAKPANDEISAMKSEIAQLLKDARNPNLTDAQHAIVVRRYDELQEKLEEKRWEARITKERERWQKENQQSSDPNARFRERVIDMINEEFPDVARNQADLAAVGAYVDYQTRVEGRPHGIALYKEGAAAVAAKRGYGTPSPPVRDQQRRAAVPSGPRASATQRPGTLTITNPKHKGMLRAAASIHKQLGGTEDDFIDSILTKE